MIVAFCVTLLVVGARFLIGHYLAQAQQLKSLYGAFIAFPLLMITIFVIWALGMVYGAALVAEGSAANGAGPVPKTRPKRTDRSTRSDDRLRRHSGLSTRRCQHAVARELRGLLMRRRDQCSDRFVVRVSTAPARR